VSHLEAGYGSRPEREEYEGRRQLYDLSADELRAQPVWWFPGSDGHLTGPDAATVLPVETDVRSGALEFPPGRYLLHTRFTLADGNTLDGHLTYDPDDAGSLGEREPTICTAHGQVPLWRGVLIPTERDLSAHFAALGRSSSAVFPLTWSSVLHPVAGPLQGRLDGFAILRNGAVTSIR
jgi:hypothetical protein